MGPARKALAGVRCGWHAGRAARQRALPSTPDLPPAQRRLDEVCASGYTGRKRGETVRTRTTVLQAHTHQWVGTFAGTAGAGNGDYRGDLRQAKSAMSTYMQAQALPLSQAVARLDGQYGNGAIVTDLAGLAYVVRGKDYDLLSLPQVQTRLAQPPDQQTTHRETGPVDPFLTSLISLFRQVVHAHGSSPLHVRRKIRLRRLAPPMGRTSTSCSTRLCHQVRLHLRMWWPCICIVVRLKRCELLKTGNKSRTAGVVIPPGARMGDAHSGQWTWNLRLELGHVLHPTPMRTTECAPAQTEPVATSGGAVQVDVAYQPPVWAVSRMGCLAGEHFTPQPDGTLQCPAASLSIPRSVALNEMAACGWFTPPGSVPAVPAQCVRSARVMGRPPRNRVA